MKALFPGMMLVAFAAGGFAAPPPSPAELYGELFRRVQMERVFPDEKDFVDCAPRRDPAAIRADYEKQKNQPGFDLAVFVRENFITPRSAADLRAHVSSLWDQLERDASEPPEHGSLLALPRPFVVPGGRFQELYYWDSYFVMLGLMESGRVRDVENMVANFAALIDAFGFIPNASRTYYLTRSQPPFFSLMLDLLAEKKGDEIYRAYRGALEKEYRFWMDEKNGHAVRVGDVTLNRYHDAEDTPREEQYRTDCQLAASANRDPSALYRDLRSAAESGWDFSSRWFADGHSRATIRTTEILPVDLNSLLYHLEITLARARKLNGDVSGSAEMEAQARRRRDAINTLFWSPEIGWYVDYNLKTSQRLDRPTLAGMMPFFLHLASRDRIAPAARMIEQNFLKSGGVVTTLTATGEQWDAPNGWAPLQWITIAGLRQYDENALAETIARRWMALNLHVYQATGRLMEKYDVIDLTRPAGGGEYPNQDGFGWTNGVLLKLFALYGEP